MADHLLRLLHERKFLRQRNKVLVIPRSQPFSVGHTVWLVLLQRISAGNAPLEIHKPGVQFWGNWHDRAHCRNSSLVTGLIPTKHITDAIMEQRHNNKPIPWQGWVAMCMFVSYDYFLL
jgi:hypothetical protein